MLGLVVIAQMILGVIPIEKPCTADRKAQCQEFMSRVFDSANPDTGLAVRLIEKERWTAAPVDLVEFADRHALIVRFDQADGGPHVAGGRYSAYYFSKESTARRPVAVFADFEQAGSFGYGGQATTKRIDSERSLLLVDAGGTWQGDTCSWTSLYEIARDGPRPLATFLSSAETSDLKVEGTLFSPLSPSMIQLRFTGSERGRQIDEIVEFRNVSGRWRRTAGRDFRAC